MEGFATAAQTTDNRLFSPFDIPLMVIPPGKIPPIRE